MYLNPGKKAFHTSSNVAQLTALLIYRTYLLQVAPLLPSFALSFVPELTQRLIGRMAARFLREGFLLSA